MKNSTPVITRFPPSPTGFLHIGGVRTALFNYLFAAHNAGEMVLRFEDTDRQRSKKEYEVDIIEGLSWVGVPHANPDAPRQSERANIYKKYIPKLIEDGYAYEAEEGRDTPGKKVIRFKNPKKVIIFEDLVRGEVSVDTTDLGDFVIARSIDEPLYHLAVVIDDHEMGVTHVLRGEDHISNTPRQILLLEALGFARPQYAHIPLILAPDKSKLSKRHGAVSVNEYKKLGIIAEALVNYLALLGWNPGGEQEVFGLAELVERFEIERVHKAGAVFDIEKLKWFNHEHLKRLSDEVYAARLKEFSKQGFDVRLVPIIKERAQTLLEATGLLGEYDFIQGVTYEPALLLNKGKISKEDAARHLQALLQTLGGIADEDFTPEHIKEVVWPYAEASGRGAVLWPLRVALSGKEKSPDPFTVATLVGKAETLSRVEKALKTL